LNPEGKSIRQLVADEAQETGTKPEVIESLFHYLKEYGFLAEVSDVVTLARAYLNVTARCNLVCPMCYFASCDSLGHEELSYEDLCLIIDALAKVGLGNLVISGGEPLLFRIFPTYWTMPGKVPHDYHSHQWNLDYQGRGGAIYQRPAQGCRSALNPPIPGFMTVFAGRAASIKRLKVFGLYFRQEYATSRLFRLSHETVFVNPRALLN